MPLSTDLQHDVEFTREGEVFDDAQVEAVLAEVPDYTDLLVLSHGWNNDIADANGLYDGLIDSFSAVLPTLSELDNRTFGAVRLFWPSKRFTDSQLIPGGGMASATGENDAALIAILEELKLDPARLGGNERNPVREINLTRAQVLVPALETDPNARFEFIFLLRSILDPAGAHPDDGSDEFFTRSPEDIFAAFSTEILAPVKAGSGGATGLSGGGAAGLDDLIRGVRAAARRIANYTTYYAMKQRAGLVGRSGLGPVLRRIRQKSPGIKLHLVGHSFGARLVTAAGHSLPASTANVTLSLLQAAFSHNGFSASFGEGNVGAFRDTIAESRVSGPVLITHTKNDRAVGVAYPLASRMARDGASALGDENDPYGGLGRNGAQHTAEAIKGVLANIGTPYDFQQNAVYNLRADDFITDHNDVAGNAVAHAILRAAAVV